MGILINRQTESDVSIQFNEIDDAYRFERNGVLTSGIFKNVIIDEDAIYNTERPDIKELVSVSSYEDGVSVPNLSIGKYTQGDIVKKSDGSHLLVIPPGNDLEIGLYDIESDTFNTLSITATFASDSFQSEYFRGASTVTLQNGEKRVVFAPADSKDIGVYDPEANTYQSYAYTLQNSSFGGRYNTADTVTLSNGEQRVIFGTWQHDKIGIFNPETNTFSEGPVVSGNVNFRDGTVVNVGGTDFVIWQRFRDDVVKYNADTESVTVIDTPNANFNVYQCVSSVILENGEPRVVMPSISSRNDTAVFNPIDDSFEFYSQNGNNDYDRSTTITFSNGESRVIFISQNAPNTPIGVFNPNDGTFTESLNLNEIVGGTLPPFHDIFSVNIENDSSVAVLTPRYHDNFGVLNEGFAQFMLRNPATGIVEGVDYDNLEQFIDPDKITVPPGSVNAAGDDRDIQINSSSTLSSATGNNIFSFTSSGELLAGTRIEESGGTIVGNYNLSPTPDGTSIFQIGNGTGDANRSNAMTVYEDGRAQFSNELITSSQFTVDGNSVSSSLKINKDDIQYPRSGFQISSAGTANNYGFRIFNDKSPSSPQETFLEIVNADSTPSNGDHNRVSLTTRSHPQVSSIVSVSGTGSDTGSSIAFGTESFSSNYTLFLERQTKNVGIDTDIPAAKLDVNGDIVASESITTNTELKSTSATGGVVLTAPDGTEYRVTVDNNGTIESTII